jgi:hypothetical protein
MQTQMRGGSSRGHSRRGGWGGGGSGGGRGGYQQRTQAATSGGGGGGGGAPWFPPPSSPQHHQQQQQQHQQHQSPFSPSNVVLKLSPSNSGIAIGAPFRMQVSPVASIPSPSGIKREHPYDSNGMHDDRNKRVKSEIGTHDNNSNSSNNSNNNDSKSGQQQSKYPRPLGPRRNRFPKTNPRHNNSNDRMGNGNDQSNTSSSSSSSSPKYVPSAGPMISLGTLSTSLPSSSQPSTLLPPPPILPTAPVAQLSLGNHATFLKPH